MFENLSDIVLRAVKEWTPKESYPNEGKYRDDLAEFLRSKLNRKEDVLFGFGTPEKHLVQREDGRGFADIGIDGKIGIELKLNLAHKSHIDRLIGQVDGFLSSYSYVIVVLCGRTSQETIDKLQHRFGKYTESAFSIGPQKIVKIVPKSGTSSQTSKKVSSPQDVIHYED